MSSSDEDWLTASRIGSDSTLGSEIDLICETSDGRFVGVEVKATATTKPDHARHLASLRDNLGDRFTAGVVLYSGNLALPLSERIMALPLSTLWES